VLVPRDGWQRAGNVLGLPGSSPDGGAAYVQPAGARDAATSGDAMKRLIIGSLAASPLAIAAVEIAVTGALLTSVHAQAQPTPCYASDPNCVYVPYTCNYDVLCDAAGNVIQGPPNGRVLLGNGQYCAGNGCTRP
jgi:hypothetical protein